MIPHGHVTVHRRYKISRTGRREYFGQKREERNSRKPHNEQLRNLTLFPKHFRVIKFWRMKLVGYVEYAGWTRNTQKILVGELGKHRPFGRT
jgi:hypothetical protein